jgi:hypothetical protein
MNVQIDFHEVFLRLINRLGDCFFKLPAFFGKP